MHGKIKPNTRRTCKCVSCVKSVKPNRGCIFGIHRIYFLVVVGCPEALRTLARIHIPKKNPREFFHRSCQVHKRLQNHNVPLHCQRRQHVKGTRIEAKVRKINSFNELIQIEWPGSCFKPKLNNTRIRTATEKSEDGRLAGRYLYALCSSLFPLITTMKRN